MKINGNISNEEVQELIKENNLTFDMFLKNYLKVVGFHRVHSQLIGATIKITTWSKTVFKN